MTRRQAMNKYWVAWMAGVMLLAAVDAVSAQPGPRGGGFDGPRGGGRFERMQGAAQEQEGGMNPGGREFRRSPRGEEGGGPRGPQAMHREGDPGGPAHLSPDERRQLRREIHEAGRDIYRSRRPDR